MGRKKLSEIEKAQALIRIKLGVFVMKIAVQLNVSKRIVYTLLKAAKSLPDSTVPKRKFGSGRKRKTSARTDHNHIFRPEVLISPSIMPASLKKKHSNLLKGYQSKQSKIGLKMTLAFPAGMQIKKPLLTEKMRKKRSTFAKKYQH